MNALLIHNDNLPTNLITSFSHNILAFKIAKQTLFEESFSFDKEAHKQLEKALKKSFDVIFLPYSLSDNYLELTGLRIAHHIRLTPEWQHTKVPIVFIGHETPQQIAKLTDMSDILFTTGIFTTDKFEYDKLKHQYEWILNEWRKGKKPILNDNEYKQFLNRIHILPPANYSSHHAIDNELALFRWSKYLKCDNLIPDVKENLATGLYFKYNRALHPVKPINKVYSAIWNFNNYQKKPKILLIDDEVNKGWKDFYEHFFNSKDNSNIDFNYLDVDFKAVDPEIFQEESKQKIDEYDPDVVLLDLRLHDEDFKEGIKPKKITGYKVLKAIKEKNSGIQVIITTASNKVWNYEPLINAGANGYIIKNGQSNVQEDIQKLGKIIRKKINRALFLKKIFKSLLKIKNLVKNLNELDEETKKSFENNIDISFELLDKSFEIPKYRNYAYLQLFLLIEDYLKQDTVFKIENYNAYVVCNNQEYLVLKLIEKEKNKVKYESAIKYNNNGFYIIKKSEYTRIIDTNFKMSALLLFKFGFQSSNENGWKDIYTTRNKKAAHSGNKNIVKHKEIEKLIDFIIYIFTSENIKHASIDKALREPSFDEMINDLKKHFGSK